MPNPALTALGYGPDDRVVIFHADDLGMCEATVTGCADLFAAGTLPSASVMMPCPWGPAAADLARQFPDADLGVHLTLTSEWPAYRWGPLSTRDPASGLLDAQGYLPATVEAVRAHADPDAVRAELHAQVSRALAWGIDASHVDAHMGAVAHPKFLPACLEVAQVHGALPMFPNLDEHGWRSHGLTAADAAQAAALTRELQRQGLPLVDHLVMLPLHEGGDHVPLIEELLLALPAGLTHFILHPARDTPELRAAAHDWAGRVANWRAFLDPRLPGVIRRSGVHVSSYRPLRALLRAAGST
ncbi:polysaccharide deacetylase family protein [Deinococcus taeanensis]|uniref:polysaccharide deacetylase family protein n=1 Tax=Deinococcus taeanensis TaxID=2737050 RepID=UPI001CDC11D5|nr:polysaccharide deacetylase family protein [Deinococcus taeanensis]UBV44048.1 polysaccharide deacetylase family protein [Deinococcus taeanensis]